MGTYMQQQRVIIVKVQTLGSLCIQMFYHFILCTLCILVPCNMGTVLLLLYYYYYITYPILFLQRSNEEININT